VLVVDDSPDLAFSLRLLLQIWGYDVMVALDGVEALTVARQYQPDIVLLDLGLPGLDGVEVARQLRREPGLAQALLVAVTGHSGDQERRRTRAAGCDHHLIKPVDPQRLKTLLEAR
jgi:two-component system CheB/CheR fusion protein